MNNFDIEKARQETRGCRNIIHFNNAGASLMPSSVCDALHTYLEDEEYYGGYETAEKYADSLAGFYQLSAKLINCSEDEIAFVENATRAWDMAFYSFKFKPGDKILTSIAEYGSNVVAYLQQAKRYGVKIIYVPNDEYGQIDVAALENLIDDKVRLISLTHIPTGGGLVNPAAKVGAIAKKYQIPFLLDACQAVGQIPIDVEDIACDMLCATGRKYLRGPRGTGFLYVRQSLLEKLEPPLLDQHAAPLVSPTQYRLRNDAKRFENWEQNCAGKYALSKAIEYSLQWGLSEIADRVYALAAQLRQQLEKVDEVILTDEGIEQCGIVTFKFKFIDPSIIQQQLAQAKINTCISAGSGSLISFSQRDIKKVIRASVHYYNDEQEITSFIRTLKKLIRS